MMASAGLRTRFATSAASRATKPRDRRSCVFVAGSGRFVPPC